VGYLGGRFQVSALQKIDLCESSKVVLVARCLKRGRDMIPAAVRQ
jgi:hypothetical protein